MGLRIHVFRSNPSFDSRLNVFHGRDALTLVNADGPFDPTDEAPAAEIRVGALGNPIIAPAGETRWIMFGGTYGATSDSRFGDAMVDVAGRHVYGALPIHDRIEPADRMPEVD